MGEIDTELLFRARQVNFSLTTDQSTLQLRNALDKTFSISLIRATGLEDNIEFPPGRGKFTDQTVGLVWSRSEWPVDGRVRVDLLVTLP